ncbi:MAG: response regulator transcription factor, partial [Candidatus Omnitrophota bacterium]
MNERLIGVVDDDPAIVKVLIDYLSKKGFVVQGFRDSEKLFAFIAREKPVLLILDLMLPGMQGLEICKKIKADERWASTSIIILSGKEAEHDKIDGLETGADDYIVKPFSLDEMYARIRAVMRRQGFGGLEQKLKIGNLVEMDLQKYEVSV